MASAKFVDNYRAAQSTVAPKKVTNNMNTIEFRDANKGESTGRQRLTLRMPNGTKQDIFLVVPQKEVIGYGSIVENTPAGTNGKLFPGAPDRSDYRGPGKAVGYSGDETQTGTVMGAILPSGETLTAKGAEEYLNGLGSKGIKIVDYEQPTQVQEHTGPAYVPGDLLLSLFGLGRRTGAVGYNFDEPQNNTSFQRFLNNIRSAGGA